MWHHNTLCATLYKPILTVHHNVSGQHLHISKTSYSRPSSSRSILTVHHSVRERHRHIDKTSYNRPSSSRSILTVHHSVRERHRHIDKTSYNRPSSSRSILTVHRNVRERHRHIDKTSYNRPSSFRSSGICSLCTNSLQLSLERNATPYIIPVGNVFRKSFRYNFWCSYVHSFFINDFN